MVLATAMAVSGTVILFLCRQRSFSGPQLLMGQNPTTPSCNLRSCISSRKWLFYYYDPWPSHASNSIWACSFLNADGKKGEKKKKRVHFSDDDVVHHYPIRNSDNKEIGSEDNSVDVESEHGWVSVDQHIPTRMPANRMALYNGILQDRLQRMTCSYWYVCICNFSLLIFMVFFKEILWLLTFLL